ncbi:hypothetical protein ACEN88_14685 [Massilia sp. CT11-108]|uniref:hypothetical protein n=1 Tax=Massilia sp. CT11-108 TaxID=3393900 RepID=UPI0039A7834E
MLLQHLVGATISTCLTGPALHGQLRDALVTDLKLSDPTSQQPFRDTEALRSIGKSRGASVSRTSTRR